METKRHLSREMEQNEEDGEEPMVVAKAAAEDIVVNLW